MRLPIPQKIRDILNADPFMAECIVGKDCAGRIEWQHAFTYAGKRRNEPWALLGMCSKHHKEEAKYKDLQKRCMKFRMIDMGLVEEARYKYPKASF